MKTKNTLLLLIAIFMIACNTNKKYSVEDPEFDEYFSNKKNIAIVKGKVLNLTEEEIKNIKLKYSLVTPFAQNNGQIKKNGKLNADGTFELEIDYAFPYQQIWLHVGKLFYAGVYANSELYIELDANDLRKKRGYMNGTGVKYLGIDGELNTLLNNHVLYQRKKQQGIRKAISKMDENRNFDNETFLSKYDSLYVLYHKIDDEFIKENPSPYSWLLKNERLSDYYGDLCVRYWNSNGSKMSEDLFERIKNHKSYLVSNSGSGFYDYFFTYLEIRTGKYAQLNLEDFRDYSKLSISDKENMVEYSEMMSQVDKEIPYDTIKLKKLSRSLYTMLRDTILAYKTLKTINYVDSLFADGKADLLKLKASSKDLKEKKIILAASLNTMNTKWCKEVLESDYKKSIEKIASIDRILKKEKSFSSNKSIGKPVAEMPFGAKLYKVDDLTAEELLSNIKTAFNGKALILDFWATWCSPCLGDMPYSKKLHDEFKKEPIEFFYLCTSSGSNIEKWKEKIAEMEIGGTHLFVASEIESELMKLFSFNGFPSYAFINKNGSYKAGAIQRMSYLNKEKLKKLIEER